LVEICIDNISGVLRATDFGYSFVSCQLGWIDAPHTQNFEISSSRANSGVKKIKIRFEIFVKMLDG
jgi:hypothetical protein